MRKKVNAALGRNVWTGIGYSMLPTILPGSRLHLEMRDRSGVGVGVGDVVCYLDKSKRFVSHRIVAVIREDGVQKLMVASDSTGRPETLDETAVVGVVKRVEHPLMSYDTRGAIGRLVSRWALDRSASFQGAALAAGMLSRLYAAAARVWRTGVRP